MQAVPGAGLEYFTYKGTQSIVLMAMVDANNHFIYVDIGCNGRVSDGGVLRDSTIGRAMFGDDTNVMMHVPLSVPLPGLIHNPGILTATLTMSIINLHELTRDIVCANIDLVFLEMTANDISSKTSVVELGDSVLAFAIFFTAMDVRQVVISQMYFRDGAASAFPVDADFNDRVYAYNKYMYDARLSSISILVQTFGSSLVSKKEKLRVLTRNKEEN